MKKHAFFLSLTDNYAYLFNALLNSIELFGIGKYADVVVMHDDSINQKYIDFINAKTSSMNTDVRFIPVCPLPSDRDLGKVMTIKFYRYKIMAEEGVNYDSICFIDTDIYLVSDVKEYFDIASHTDLYVGVNDNVVRHYKSNPNEGTCPCEFKDGKRGEPVFKRQLWDGKFICNTPMFIDMNKYGNVFLDVFEQRGKLGMDTTYPFNGDLETMNIVLNKHKTKDRLLVLASHLWTNVHYSIYRTSLLSRCVNVPLSVDISDPNYNRSIMFMSETQEHIRAFHGRDWASEKNEERLKTHNIPKLLGQMEGEYNASSAARREGVFDEIQAYFLFLQFECSINLEELDKIIPIREFDYLKRRRHDLAGRIGRFKI